MHTVFISHNSRDAHIANAICHHLEENGIRCWMAPRDIHHTDWVDSIMEGIKQCDVFVVIISHHSIESQEVTKEVTQATRHCQYILPFKIDREMLNQRLDYHLSPCYWLDAVNPPLEAHIAKLKDRILHLEEIDEIYVNQKCRRLIGNLPKTRTLFVGRDEEMEEYEKALEYCELSYQKHYTRFNREITSCVYSLTDKGICYSRLKRFDDAETYLTRALALNIKQNGEASLVTARTKEAIAENKKLQGKIEEAKRLYLELEMELEKYFGADNPEVLRLRMIQNELS